MKADRQARILALITEHPIETQEELADRLVAEGFKVTQATVSRDIRELRLTKVIGALRLSVAQGSGVFSEVCPSIAGWFCFCGNRGKYSGHQDGDRNGNGGSDSTG